MEADAAYQGCLPSCKLHSRSLAVKHTAKFVDCTCDLETAHTCYAISRLRTCVMQSPDCLLNLGILRMRNAISRLRKFSDCTEQIHWVHITNPPPKGMTQTLCFTAACTMTSTSLWQPAEDDRHSTYTQTKTSQYSISPSFPKP